MSKRTITNEHYGIMLISLMIGHLSGLEEKAKRDNGDSMRFVDGNISVWFNDKQKKVMVRRLSDLREWSTEGADDIEEFTKNISKTVNLPIILQS